jgi:hypothetical protein
VRLARAWPTCSRIISFNFKEPNPIYPRMNLFLWRESHVSVSECFANRGASHA